MCEAGDRVVFNDEEGSYIMNKRTGRGTTWMGIYRFVIQIPKELASVEKEETRNGESVCTTGIECSNRFEALAESFRRQDHSGRTQAYCHRTTLRGSL